MPSLSRWSSSDLSASMHPMCLSQQIYGADFHMLLTCACARHLSPHVHRICRWSGAPTWHAAPRQPPYPASWAYWARSILLPCMPPRAPCSTCCWPPQTPPPSCTPWCRPWRKGPPSPASRSPPELLMRLQHGPHGDHAWELGIVSAPSCMCWTACMRYCAVPKYNDAGCFVMPLLGFDVA